MFEDIDVILTPQQKGAITKAERYTKEQRDEWSRKGGRKKHPNKGFGSNPDNTGGRKRKRERLENEYAEHN